MYLNCYTKLRCVSLFNLHLKQMCWRNISPSDLAFQVVCIVTCLCSILFLDTLSFARLLFFCPLKTLKRMIRCSWVNVRARFAHLKELLVLEANPVDYSSDKPNLNVFLSKTLTFLLRLLTQRTSILNMKSLEAS